MNRARFIRIFEEMVDFVKYKQSEFHEGIEEKQDYYIVNEDIKGVGYFIHIVPKDDFGEFRKQRIDQPHKFYGSSVLCGRRNGKEIRVSCFGINASELDNRLIK